MKSKERVAKQGVAREGKMEGSNLCVLGEGGGERKKHKSVYFTVILLSRIF